MPDRKTLAAKVHAEIIAVSGSSPREVGAAMLITEDGISGSIGGGTLEWHVMAEAQKMLTQNSGTAEAQEKIIKKILGPDLGQCCGGAVSVRLRVLQGDTQMLQRPAAKPLRQIHIWGAGHVGRALIMALAPFPFEIHWWDGRDNAFPQYLPAHVTAHHSDASEEFLALLKPESLVVVMSHSHALDFSIVDVALRAETTAYVGLIGSSTKRARFLSRLKAAGHSDFSKFICPIGKSGLASKLPAAIAATTLVEILEVDERLQQGLLIDKNSADAAPENWLGETKLG